MTDTDCNTDTIRSLRLSHLPIVLNTSNSSKSSLWYTPRHSVRLLPGYKTGSLNARFFPLQKQLATTRSS
jgi:hypothetical protein